MLWFLFFPGFFCCRRPILYFCAVFDSRVKIPNKKKHVLSKWTWKNHQTSKKFRRVAKVGKASDNDQSCSEWPFSYDLSKNRFARVVRDKVNDFSVNLFGPYLRFVFKSGYNCVCKVREIWFKKSNFWLKIVKNRTLLKLYCYYLNPIFADLGS